MLKKRDNSTNMSQLFRISTLLAPLTVFNNKAWCGYLENSLPSANQDGGKYGGENNFHE